MEEISSVRKGGAGQSKDSLSASSCEVLEFFKLMSTFSFCQFKLKLIKYPFKSHPDPAIYNISVGPRNIGDIS